MTYEQVPPTDDSQIEAVILEFPMRTASEETDVIDITLADNPSHDSLAGDHSPMNESEGYASPTTDPAMLTLAAASLADIFFADAAAIRREQRPLRVVPGPEVIETDRLEGSAE